ncbi:MAG: RCC1 domain-containing protein [Pseudomonadota bacterium]|nr:RCC1 domain-containing protein [Pseudomonadota bacterium]
MKRPLAVVVSLLALSALACLGPRPAFPEGSTCGSTLAAGPALASPLTLAPAGTLGTSCVVATDGVLRCAWSKPPPTGPLAHVSLDSSTICAIYTDGKLWCDVAVDDYGSSPPFEDAGPWARVAVQSRAACAVRADGTLWCRGVEEPPSGAFVDVAVGYAHGCALAGDGSVSCWGEDDWCQDDAPPGPYVDIAAAEQSTCGARADGGVDCWGNTIEGLPVHAGKAVEVVVTAGASVCARYDDGTVACGDPTWRVPTGRFVALSTNGFLMKNACALRDDGTVVCFGPDDTWPDGATGVVMPAEPADYNAPTWYPYSKGAFGWKLPCETTPEVSPGGSVERTACMRSDPAELIALEVITPPQELVAAGPQAMLAYAQDAKVYAFAGARLTRSNPLELDGRPGIAYAIEMPSTGIVGRAYVDGGRVYALTGMYDTTATSGNGYGRVTDSVASGRFATAVTPAVTPAVAPSVAP